MGASRFMEREGTGLEKRTMTTTKVRSAAEPGSLLIYYGEDADPKIITNTYRCHGATASYPNALCIVNGWIGRKECRDLWLLSQVDKSILQVYNSHSGIRNSRQPPKKIWPVQLARGMLKSSGEISLSMKEGHAMTTEDHRTISERRVPEYTLLGEFGRRATSAGNHVAPEECLLLRLCGEGVLAQSAEDGMQAIILVNSLSYKAAYVTYADYVCLASHTVFKRCVLSLLDSSAGSIRTNEASEDKLFRMITGPNISVAEGSLQHGVVSGIRPMACHGGLAPAFIAWIKPGPLLLHRCIVSMLTMLTSELCSYSPSLTDMASRSIVPSHPNDADMRGCIASLSPGADIACQPLSANMSAIVSTMKEHGLQALLMPTHHFLIAVDAYGLEGRGGRVVRGNAKMQDKPIVVVTYKSSTSFRTTTTITTAASADPLPNPSTASASGDVPMPNKPLHELFRVMSRYQILKTAKSLIVGEACIRHHLNEYRPLERIDILVLTDASPMTLRNLLRFDGSKYFSESGALGCAIKMTLPSFLPIICTIETIAPRQLERTTEDYRLQICCQAFRGVHQLQYVPEEGLPFLGLPSIILMEVLLPPEPTVSINASLVWKLAQRLDPNSEGLANSGVRLSAFITMSWQTGWKISPLIE
ncbi:uncharacterized protein BO96DRAFT_438629 [Aspergillus niger CBS 101883]|uniref:uncharacterized protein n=1 Tax=Aspergillus lacticoffeatus (strain CBS 101883) TaxID=1450533 RepID=UPI000D7FCB23|nr:uncharacterized protein BO96DRAFT_438629 [Aspergillus niger CBS 101883]PYH51774.1 hypothetical protein BO96DRAFT_438629 [Aspergillus niger CBS 101883]